MSIYLLLFLTFLKIGAVSFGGGYGMISLVREEVLQHGWLTEEQFVNMIAVSESTPGPIAINMATFIGSMQAGIWGSVCATLGVVLPSFIIILLIASVINNFLKFLPYLIFPKVNLSYLYQSDRKLQFVGKLVFLILMI